MTARQRPPRAPARLARWLLSPDDASRLLDALDDEYDRYQRPRRTRLGADLWYWLQVLRSVPALRGALRRRSQRSLRTDLLHLSRNIRRSPISAGAAILTLSLTLGASTAIFAVVDRVLLEPPPFADPKALVTIGEVPADGPTAVPRSVSYATFDAWRAQAASLAGLEAYDPTNVTLTGLGPAERLSVTNATPGFLALLGVTPSRGRLFDPDDSGRAVVIVGDTFWRGRLGADPTAIGREVVLGGQSHTIVGVLPERFFFALNPSDVWRPFPESLLEADDDTRVRVIGRLADGVSAEGLATTLEDVSRNAIPSSRVWTTPFTAAIVGGSEQTLRLLAGAAALAMLVAFVNLAVLLMVRSIDRRRELAVRRALGAPGSETARQLVLESVGLVSLGILGGVVLAYWLTPAVGQLALEFGGLAQRDLQVSRGGLGIVAIVALACAATCGLLSSLGTARWQIVDILRQATTPPPREVTIRQVFVAGEVASAFVLLLSMALLGGSLLNVLSVDPGFDSRGVLKLQVSLPSVSYRTRPSAVAFYSSAQNAIRERLGPGTVSMADEIPLTGGGGRGLVGRRREALELEAVVRTAAPGYFDVMRIPVVAGRSFDSAADASAPTRVVVSEAVADALFGDEQPIGQELWLDGIGQTAEVIGVAGDVKHRSLEEAPLPTVYLSALQFPSASSIFVVRSALPKESVIATVREEVGRLDGNVPVYSVRSMRDVVAASPGVPSRRLLSATSTGFALLAVALSMIGLFGVASHDLESRRTELALRMALGAGRSRVLRTLLWKGLVMVGFGLAVGAVMSAWIARALGAVLFTVDGSDVLISGLVTAVVLVGASGAAVIPVAVRATRSDLMSLLRGE